MRVLIYVPPARGADRTRRMIEREVRRRGYEPRGAGTDSPAVAYAAWVSGEVDLLAGRPEHLLELSNRFVFARKPWALPVAAGRPVPAAALALLAPLAGAVAWARRHPARLGTATAGLAALAAGLALVLSPADEPIPDVGLPPVLPSPSAAPSSSPAPPSSPPPTTATPPAERAPAEPVGGAGAGGPAPATHRPPTHRPPTSRPPAARRPPASPTPPASSRPPERGHCIIRVDALGLNLRVCLGQSSG